MRSTPANNQTSATPDSTSGQLAVAKSGVHFPFHRFPTELQLRVYQAAANTISSVQPIKVTHADVLLQSGGRNLDGTANISNQEVSVTRPSSQHAAIHPFMALCSEARGAMLGHEAMLFTAHALLFSTYWNLFPPSRLGDNNTPAHYVSGSELPLLSGATRDVVWGKRDETLYVRGLRMSPAMYLTVIARVFGAGVKRLHLLGPGLPDPQPHDDPADVVTVAVPETGRTYRLKRHAPVPHGNFEGNLVGEMGRGLPYVDLTNHPDLYSQIDDDEVGEFDDSDSFVFDINRKDEGERKMYGEVLRYYRGGEIEVNAGLKHTLWEASGMPREFTRVRLGQVIEVAAARLEELEYISVLGRVE